MFNKLSALMYNKKDIASLIKKQIIDSLSEKFESQKVIRALAKEGYTNIQLLLAEYLGLLDAIQNVSNVDKSYLLQILFNHLGAENIRRKLSFIGDYESQIKTLENLEIVYLVFKELKMNEFADKVKIDIDRISRINKKKVVG